MPVFSTTRTYQDNTTLTQAELDAAFNSIETFLNTTKLDATNLQNGVVTSSLIAAGAVTSTAIAAGAVNSSAIAASAVIRSSITTNEQIPTGAMFEYPVGTAPNGWLNCDGSAVSRNTYATLFGVISTVFGAGDGSTTFNLPDRRGRVAIGQGQGAGLTNRTLAQTGGEETHLLTSAESGLPNHTHTVNGLAANSQFAATGSDVNTIREPTTGASPGVDGGAQNAASAHNNMQPYIVMNYIIKY